MSDVALRRECHRLLDGMWDNSNNTRKRERGYQWLKELMGREFHFSGSYTPNELRIVYRELLKRAKKKHPELLKEATT